MPDPRAAASVRCPNSDSNAPAVHPSTIEQAVEVTGQVVHKRTLSKKLVFFDIKLASNVDSSPSPVDVNSQFIELVIKVEIYGDIQAVQAARDGFGLGDVVKAVGTLDPQGSLRVMSLTAISKWNPVKCVGGPQFQPDESALAWWAQSVRGRKTTGKTSAASTFTGHTSKHSQQVEEPAVQLHQNSEHPTPSAAITDDMNKMDSRVFNPELSKRSSDGVQGATQGLASASQVCKWWINSGRCAHGSQCALLHPTGELRQMYLKIWMTERKASRKDSAQQDGFFVHRPSDLAAVKGLRASVLASWMVDTWGKDALNRGSGVLDVAGGRGALSWELQVVHGVRVTLVEPREFKLDRNQHKVLKALAAKSSSQTTVMAEGSVAPSPAAAGLAPTDAGVDAQSSTTLLGQAVMYDVHSTQSTTQSAGVSVSIATVKVREEADWQDVGHTQGIGADLGHRPVPKVRHIHLAVGLSITQITSWFDHQLWGMAVQHAAAISETNTEHGAVQGQMQVQGIDQVLGFSDEISSLVSSCSVVVGLHPDQATDEILRFACAAGKPFCIVPCCVFPRQFPHRRLRQTPASVVGKHTSSVQATCPVALVVDTPGVPSASMGSQGAHAADDGMWAVPQELFRGGGAGFGSGNEGVPVTQYSELVQYLLQEGGAGTREGCLRFEGANRMVYRM